MKKITFLSDGLSIDETKTSVLVLAFIIVLSFAVYFYYRDGVIGNNLTNIITTLILTIGGVNAINSASKILRSDKGNENITEDML